MGMTTLPSQVICIIYHLDAVWVGLASGSLAVFRRDPRNGCWDLSSPQMILLGDEPVACILPMMSGGGGALYAACGKRVWVIDAFTNEQIVSLKNTLKYC